MRSSTARFLLVIVLIIVGMVWAGWLTFRRSGESSTIEVNTGEMKRDTDQAIDEGKRLLNKAEQSIDHSAQPAPQPAPLPAD